MRTPTYVWVELKRRDPAAQGVNTTPLQATDRVILAGFNGLSAYNVTMAECLIRRTGGSKGWVSHLARACLMLLRLVNTHNGDGNPRRACQRHCRREVARVVAGNVAPPRVDGAWNIAPDAAEDGSVVPRRPRVVTERCHQCVRADHSNRTRTSQAPSIQRQHRPAVLRIGGGEVHARLPPRVCGDGTGLVGQQHDAFLCSLHDAKSR